MRDGADPGLQNGDESASSVQRAAMRRACRGSAHGRAPCSPSDRLAGRSLYIYLLPAAGPALRRIAVAARLPPRPLVRAGQDTFAANPAGSSR